MTRPLKFRAWNEATGMYIRDGQGLTLWDIYCEGEDLSNSAFRSRDYPAFTFNNLTFEQFTGLTDKNGKEIYEGDIVRDQDGEVGEIYWEGLGFTATNYLGDAPASWIPYGEVIGNIHENKDLLK